MTAPDIYLVDDGGPLVPLPWRPSPEVFAHYINREVELARHNVGIQLREIARKRKAGHIRVDRVTRKGPRGEETHATSVDVQLCCAASHRTLMLAAEVRP